MEKQNIFIWDAEGLEKSERPLFSFKDNFIQECSFNKQGDKIISLSGETRQTIRIWDASN